MKITFLGTGAGVPAKERNVSSLVLHLDNNSGELWMFDCGEATQQQILHTAIKLRKISKIFITHLHGDHIFGLPGLLGSRSFQGAQTPLKIYGPKGIKDFIDTSLKVSSTYLKYPLMIHEFCEEKCQLFYENRFTVSAAKLDHNLPSYGFRIVEDDLPGPLLIDKVKQENIPIGPILQKLKAGLTVTLDDGRVIDGREFVGPPKKGKIIAVLGDTRYTETAVELAKEANVLVHEATFSSREQNLATEYFHSTTHDAAAVAKKANAKQLILNHISSRYQKEDVYVLLKEARAIFPNTFVSQDFATFSIG